MPINYSVTQQGQLVLERWHRLVTADEYLANRRRQQADSTIAARAALLVDVRAARLDAPDDDSRWQVTAEPGRPSRFSRCAIVAQGFGYDAIAPIAQRFTGQGITTIVFFNVATACTWVGLDLALALDLLTALGAPPTPDLLVVELQGERLPIGGPKAHGRRGATGRQLLSKLME